MRASIALTAVLAVGAVASPLGGLDRLFKRAMKTEYSYVTTTIYVTAEAEATEAPQPTTKSWHWHGNGKGHHSSQAAAAPAPTAVVEPQPPAEQQQANTEAAEQQPPAQAAPTTQAAPQPAATQQSTGNSYSDQVLRHHNVHRANHSVSDVQWSNALAATALKIAKSCVYAHDTSTDGGGYGQNIAAGAPADQIGNVISDLFYNGEVGFFDPYYGQPTPQINGNWDAGFDKFGHFTQIVWKGTTEVGCATYDCHAGGLANVGGNVPPYFTVCNYKGPGNYLGEFDKNVFKPQGHAYAGGSY